MKNKETLLWLFYNDGKLLKLLKKLNLFRASADRLSMKWKDFFTITIHHQSKEFFTATLPVKETFRPEDLLEEHFANFDLKLSLNQRKILIRHCVFHTEEFKILTQDFLKKVSELPGKHHAFSTHGAGMYLFLKAQHLGFSRPLSLHCQTSEVPLPLYPKSYASNIELHMSFRPEQKTYFGNFPMLWQDSWTLDLFEIDDSEDQVA